MLELLELLPYIKVLELCIENTPCIMKFAFNYHIFTLHEMICINKYSIYFIQVLLILFIFLTSYFITVYPFPFEEMVIPS